MFAKITSKNQLTLPKSVTDALGDVSYFDVTAKEGQIILTPVRIQRADASAGSYAYRLFEQLPTMPRFTVERVRAALDTSFPTANLAVNQLEALGIVVETGGLRKNRSFGYTKYSELLTG